MKENNWKAGCNESCTSGLVGGSKKSADDKYSNSVSTVAPLDSTQHLEGQLDLNEHLIKNPPATFFLRVSGDSMTGASIHPDDLLVVDRSLEPKSGKIVIAVINGELTVKRLHKEKDRIQLLAENPAYPPINITPEMDFQVWGVVTYVIHKP
jgi:DNA polymerase V